MTTILYFDCFAGISGDMTIGALLDLGVDQTEFLRQLGSLKVEGYQIDITKKQVNGIASTDFDVIVPESHHKGKHHHPHRKLSDIEKIIDQGDIPDDAKHLSRKIFQRIAQSEARVHNVAVDEIHFHEVGAIDSIVDIVGAAICLHLLKPDRIYSSPLHVGSGTVKCAHGTLPVPAPATADILEGVPVYSTGLIGELVTPTGAGIIKTIADEFIPLPAMTARKTGYGCGKKRFEIPNTLRVFLGDEISADDTRTDTLVLLETNIDDLNPEVYSYLVPLLMEAGALDVYLTPIIMKKGRPGNIVSVLCDPGQEAEFEDRLFRETSTLGIRKYTVSRKCLKRESLSVNLPSGTVKVKAAYRNGELLKLAPEYEDCRKIAESRGIPIREIYHQALSRAHELIREGSSD